MTTAHAKIHSETFFIIHELVHGPLPPAAVLCRAGVMASRFQRKVNIVAGIIAFITDTGILDLYVGDLETMAGWADERAGVATYTIA